MTMDRTSRVDRRLPGLFEELADARTPDYLEAAIERASSRHQRPAWTFPGRWLPMAEITSRATFGPRLPWRTVGVALVILALLAATIAVIGSRRAVPPPFGPARNGIMVFGAGGDLYALDPAKGSATAIVAGPETDQAPMLSRDGTKFAFFRATGTGPDRQLVVANLDGTGQRVISTDPVTFDYSVNWSANGRTLVLDDTRGHVTWLDAIGNAPPEKRTYPGVTDLVALRPPDEVEFLSHAASAKGWSLQVMDVDGTRARPLLSADVTSPRDDDYSGYSWSPDGSKVAFRMHPDASDDMRIFIVNADGTGLRRLTHEAGTWCECDMFWSPDGTQIAMNRWEFDPTKGEWHGHAVAIVNVMDGSLREIGPMPPDDRGAEFAFSPDGASLTWMPRGDALGAASFKPILLDVATGAARSVDASIDAGLDWQRLAPD